MTKKFCDCCGKPALDQSSIMSLQPIAKDNPNRAEVRIVFYKDSGERMGPKVDLDLCTACRASFVQAVMKGVIAPQLRREGITDLSRGYGEAFVQ